MRQAFWHTVYTPKLPMTIREAEAAIFLQIQNLDSDQEHEPEVIGNAFSSLRALQRTLLRYPSRQVA